MKFIYKGEANSAGIYKILNLVNGRFYLGSTYRFKKRWPEHKSQLRRGVHPNGPLQSDFNLFGEDSFSIEVFQDIPEKKERLQAEIALIRQHFDNQRRCYNISIEGPPSQEGKRRTEETKMKMRASHQGTKRGPVSNETRENLRLAALGRSHSEVTKAKISLALQNNLNQRRKGTPLTKEHKEAIRSSKLGRKYGPMSEETKAKLSASKRGKPKSETHKQALRESALRKRQAVEESNPARGKIWSLACAQHPA